MIYPPNGSDYFNRASFPKEKVLYGGWNELLALEEIGAKSGDHVQLISFRVRPGAEFTCSLIGELQAIYNSGRSMVNSKSVEDKINQKIQSASTIFEIIPLHVNLFIDSVISEIFRFNVVDNEDYLLSATISQNFFLKNGKGLIYPSVRTAHCINIAVDADDFDRKFEVLDTQFIKINAYHGYGIYYSQLIKQTSDISKEGNFLWSSSRKIQRSLGEVRNLEVPPDYSGWRVE